MPVPSYDKIMYPMLELAKDGQEKNINELIVPLADILRLSEEERSERKNNHRNSTKFAYRAAWAKTYLTKAGLINKTGRSRFVITERGLTVLNDKDVTTLDKTFLMKFDEFADFATHNKTETDKETSEEQEGQAPVETLQNAFKIINETLISDLIDTLKDCTPADFEKIVVDVLLGMGYGGTDAYSGVIGH